MVAVAITGILGALALPSFLAQMNQGRRTDAVDALSAVQQAQERWRGMQASYAASLSALGLTASSKAGDYGVALSNVTANGYTVQATAVAGRRQAADTVCATITLTVSGGNISSAPETCWKR